MHDGSIRYMGLGVFLYIMAPIVILYGAFVLISQGGNQMIDWLLSVTPPVASISTGSGTEEETSAPEVFLTSAPAPRDGGMNGFTQNRQPRDERIEDGYTEESERTVPMDADGYFTIGNISGNITITSWNRSEARIHAKKVARTDDEEEAKEAFGEVTIEIDEHSGDVEVRTRYPDWRDGGWGNRTHVSVYYEVSLPEKAMVRANSVSGNVEVSDIQGEVEANTVSGAVLVRAIGNRVRAKSVSGDVEAQDLKGDSVLESVSGSIEARAITGDVEANTTSGRIELRDITARRLSAKTTSGTVTFEGAIVAQGRYEMESLSGSIRLTIPSDAAFELHAKTFSGSIESDLPVTLRGAVSSRHGRQKSLDGAVNGGGAEVELSAFSGSIQIRTR